MGFPVTHFEITGKDPVLLQNFYAQAFGWEMKSQMPGYAMAHTGSPQGIAGGIGAAMGGGSGHVTFYVEVDEVAATLLHIEQLGGRTILPATSLPDGPTIGLFHDPEGHLIGLACPRGVQ
jgi:predicted enzyme related to lactoylglutathione lyase